MQEKNIADAWYVSPVSHFCPFLAVKKNATIRSGYHVWEYLHMVQIWQEGLGSSCGRHWGWGEFCISKADLSVQHHWQLLPPSPSWPMIADLYTSWLQNDALHMRHTIAFNYKPTENWCWAGRYITKHSRFFSPVLTSNLLVWIYSRFSRGQ